MSMMDEPSEDIFNQLTAGLGNLFDGVEEDVVDVSTMTNEELLNQGSDILEELLKAGQAINPTTQWARDKHSLRNAIQIEIRKRESK